MNLHEYQSKQWLGEYGIPVPQGHYCASPEAAAESVAAIAADAWVVKAQIHSGARGKAGGVRVVQSAAEAAGCARDLIGSRLVTHQTGAEGLPVAGVLVEAVRPIARELYLSLVLDRASGRLVFVASASGGMEIETLAHDHPECILTTLVHPAAGLQPYQCRQLAFGLGLEGAAIQQLATIMQGMYRLYLDRDLSQLEINPLVLLQDGGLVALDAKISLDDNALYLHPEVLALRDVAQEDAREAEAQKHGLNYVSLDGTIGCMVNGAGLAMATMDMVQLHGGAPANFLDVGGGATAARVAEAFKLILSDARVRVVLVNIFGGIVRCSLIAEGVIEAVREVGVRVPVIVRLEGTEAAEGRALLAASGLDILAAQDLDEAARCAVEAAA